MEGLLSAMSGKKRSDRPTLPLSKTGKPDRNIVKNPPRHPKSEQLKPGSEGRLPGTPRLIGRREPRLPQCPQRPSDYAAHRGRLDSPPPPPWGFMWLLDSAVSASLPLHQRVPGLFSIFWRGRRRGAAHGGWRLLPRCSILDLVGAET